MEEVVCITNTNPPQRLLSSTFHSFGKNHNKYDVAARPSHPAAPQPSPIQQDGKLSVVKRDVTPTVARKTVCDNCQYLEVVTADQLIPPGKTPGCRLVGIKVFTRVIAKSITDVVKKTSGRRLGTCRCVKVSGVAQNLPATPS